jgi:hypothetical protein
MTAEMKLDPDVDSIEGWLDQVDRKLLRHIALLQTALGISGDLLEIGTYRGKSAVVLGSGLAGDESLHVCDLFESTPESVDNRREYDRLYSGLARNQFEATYSGFLRRPPVIHHCDSRELPKRIAPETFRLVHVDGAHVHDVATVDIQTAISACNANGLIVFDDHLNGRYPGLLSAIWSAVERGEVTPLLLTSNKLYATVDASSAVRTSLQDDVRHCGAFGTEPASYRDRSVLWVGGFSGDVPPTSTLRQLLAQLPSATRAAVAHRWRHLADRDHERAHG